MDRFLDPLRSMAEKDGYYTPERVAALTAFKKEYNPGAADAVPLCARIRQGIAHDARRRYELLHPAFVAVFSREETLDPEIRKLIARGQQ